MFNVVLEKRVVELTQMAFTRHSKRLVACEPNAVWQAFVAGYIHLISLPFDRTVDCGPPDPACSRAKCSPESFCPPRLVLVVGFRIAGRSQRCGLPRVRRPKSFNDETRGKCGDVSAGAHGIFRPRYVI